DPVRAEVQVRISETRVSERVLLVFLNRLLEILDGILVALDRALVPVVTALQVQLVRLGIVRVTLRDALLVRAAEARPKFVENLVRDLILYGQKVRLWTIVLATPELRALGDVHQLRADHQTVVARGNLAGDQRPHIQGA